MANELDKSQKYVIDKILQDLESNKVPWRKPWHQSKQLMVNGTTNKVYRGRNQMYLQIVASASGYTDPRWVTFKQCQDEGWKVKKGSSAVPITFFSVENIEDENSILKDKVISKTYKVFNAAQIEGIPELASEQKVIMEFSNVVAQKFTNNVIKNLGVGYIEPAEKPLYNFKEDAIKMPDRKLFANEQFFYGTLFHEIGHATGHEKRLNRNFDEMKEIQERAYEELVAELNTAMIQLDLGFEIDERHVQQHTSYCSSWHKVIKDNPNAFFDALKDATTARKYILGRGQYSEFYDAKDLGKVKEEFKPEKKEYKHDPNSKIITTDDIKSQIDIVEYAQSIGLNTISERHGMTRLEIHDSCKIYPNNTFFRWSNRRGGSIIDFISEFQELSIGEAIKVAKQYLNENGASNIQYKEVKPIVFEMPNKAFNDNKVIKYLTEKRCIDMDVVSKYINQNLIYQDDRGNCVFVGKINNIAKYAALRGTTKDYKGDVGGSAKETGVYFENANAKTLVITESVIDQMSYQCIVDNPNDSNYLSINGVANAVNAIDFHFNKRDNGNVKNVIVALDNDDPGNEAVVTLSQWFKTNRPEIEFNCILPDNHDLNVDLVLSVNGELPQQITQSNEMEQQMFIPDMGGDYIGD